MLSKMVSNKGKKKDLLSCLQINPKEATVFIAIFILFFFLNVFILKDTFNTNSIIIQIFNKELNVTEVFGEKWNAFKITYFLSYGVFCTIVLFKFRNVIKSTMYEVLKLIQGDVKFEQNLSDNGLKFGKDSSGNQLYIKEETLYQNLLVTGSIGSGKTSGAVSNLCYELIKTGKGGLILDAKGSFVDIITHICKKTGRMKDLKIISLESNAYFNLLNQNISNLELAARLKQVIYLLTTNNNSDSYWFDKVENLLANILILIDYYNKESKNIMEIHKLVSNTEYLKEKINLTKKLLLKNPPDDKTCFEIGNVISFLQNEFVKLDSRVSTIIKSEITRLTIPLITEYEIYRKFCINEGCREEVTFEEVSNQIVVLSINIGQRKSLAKIIAIFLKLSFQKNVLSNISKSKASFFIADEYQEFANIEDAHFLSLSRETKCMNIISTQSYSSLRSAVKDEGITSVIIQNLVNKVWFRNDDNYTISEAIKQLGKVNVVKENKIISENSQESKKYIFKEGFRNKKSSISSSISFTVNKENEYDENFFTRELKTFESLAFISDGRKILEPKKVIFERWDGND